MVTIRIDRRVLYALLIVLVLMVALIGGIFLGRLGNSGSQSAASVPPAQPNVGAPVQGQPPASNQPLPIPPSQAQAPADNTPRVGLAEARAKLDQGTAVFVDVRTAGEYQQSRVKGAINIPVNDMPTRFNELPKDKDVIIY